MNTTLLPPKLRRHRRVQATRLPGGPSTLRFALSGMPALIRLDSVCAYLDQKSQVILSQIEAGDLRWAFDIRSANSRRREIRVARQSLFEFARLSEPLCHSQSESGEFLEIMDQILPPEKTIPAAAPGKLPQPALCCFDVAKSFSCQTQHIHNLIHEQSLSAVSSPCRPKSSPFVTRASLIAFLQLRRIK